MVVLHVLQRCAEGQMRRGVSATAMVCRRRMRGFASRWPCFCSPLTLDMADTATPALDRSLVRGIAWTGGVRWLTQLTSWDATLVVASILTPADYGLVGMALIAVGIAQLVGEAGVGAGPG